MTETSTFRLGLHHTERKNIIHAVKTVLDEQGPWHFAHVKTRCGIPALFVRLDPEVAVRATVPRCRRCFR